MARKDRSRGLERAVGILAGLVCGALLGVLVFVVALVGTGFGLGLTSIVWFIAGGAAAGLLLGAAFPRVSAAVFDVVWELLFWL